MEVKLKENSSVKILNHSGNEILEVHEDGTIDGGGTKLYKHAIKYRGGYVYIVNKSSSPISDRYYVPMAMNSSNCVSAKYNSGGAYYNQILRIVNGEYDDTICYIDEYGQVGSLPVEFQNDTVTEL